MACLSTRISVREIWLLDICFLIICLPWAMAQTGFVSLDCGATGGSYTDSNTGIEWSPDSGFGLSTVSNTTSVTPLGPVQFSTIRFFPGEQTKYCYEFNKIDHGIQQGSGYLIRASFWAGDSVPFHTRVRQQINFRLLINSDEWDVVSVALPQSTAAVVKEMYVVADTPSIAVCLAGRSIGMDTPFISSLVLRPLDPDMKPLLLMEKDEPRASRALFLVRRVNYGAPSSNYIVSYFGPSGDRFDRVWEPDTSQPSIFTLQTVNTNIADHPPLPVMQTAYQSNESFNISIPVASGHSYYFALYFSEISDSVNAAGQRVFKLDVRNDAGVVFKDRTIDLYAKANMSLYGIYETTSANFPAFVGDEGVLNFSFQRLPNSTYGPLICGMEVLRVSDNDMSLGTLDGDVAAVKQFTTIFTSLNSWSGDPCLPYAYQWLNCTTAGQPRISILSLSNKSLHGEIPAMINNLTALVEVSLAQNKLSGSIPDLSALQNLNFLDLHDNTLSGPIPEFLAQLSNLTTLLLQNNNFSGHVPSALLEKASASNLNLSISGNPLLCGSSNHSYCSSQDQTRRSKNHAHLVVGLAVTGAIIALVVLLFCIVKQKSKRDNHGNIIPRVIIDARANLARCFTYQDIKTITNNFATKLGQGGFGPVYHGVLPDGVNVAVKVLSEDSRQGEQEFVNEVDLLSRTHHKNLVGLVGYCTEEELMLVYEFMSKGSLFDVLRGNGAKLLAWRDRLKIAVGSAAGLEYLHKGCNPRIVHRDVKSSNILLNEELEGKISDFGISRSKLGTTGEDDTEMYTIVQGSIGYLDPEYAATNIATHKIDVYAFGIVLLEIITGRPPLIHQPSGQRLHIVEWVRPLIERGDINEIVDATIANDYNLSSMWRVIDVAMMCVVLDGNKRPDMTEVAADLKSALSMELQNEDASSFDNPSYSYSTDVHVR